MKYMNELKRLQKEVREIQDAAGGIRYIFKEPNESESECLKRYGLEKDMPGITVIITKWADSPIQPDVGRGINPRAFEDKPRFTLDEIKAEIARREAACNCEDCTCERQLAEETGKPLSTIHQSNQRGKKLVTLSQKDGLTTEPDSTLDPQPMRLDDLSRLGR